MDGIGSEERPTNLTELAFFIVTKPMIGFPEYIWWSNGIKKRMVLSKENYFVLVLMDQNSPISMQLSELGIFYTIIPNSILSKRSQWHHVECPHCKSNFHPKMRNFSLGLNKDNKHIYVYYQICPRCEDSIVGIKVLKDGQSICNPNDTEDLVLLHHK